jgi:hypothetical protein
MNRADARVVIVASLCARSGNSTRPSSTSAIHSASSRYVPIRTHNEPSQKRRRTGHLTRCLNFEAGLRRAVLRDGDREPHVELGWSPVQLR